ncbi:MAG: hypothetical protein GYB31_13305 [Bacteroidetes bacterium]|nr:hypothetical protein [Bacteroidota bacterium]
MLKFPYSLFLFLFLLWSASANAQMYVGQDTLYGNEWIDFDQSYFKFGLADDGIYRLTYDQLDDVIPAGVQADQIRLYRLGEEIPIYTTTEGTLQAGDYIEFAGRRNRTELDQHLFKINDDILHPDYSFFSDTAYYFITWESNSNGKRYETIDNDLSNPPAAEDFFLHTRIFQYTQDYIKASVKIGSANVQQSFFGEAEGFSTGFSGGPTRTLTIDPGPVYASGPDAEMTVNFACRNGFHHQFVSINGQNYVEDEFSGYKARTHSFDVPVSELQGQTDVVFEGTFDNNDKQAVAYISLKAPRPFDFEGEAVFTFDLPASANEQYLEISQFSANGQDPVLYDITNQQRLIATLDNGLIKILLPPSTEDRQLVLSSQSAILSPTNPKEIDFTDFTQVDPEYLVLYSRALTTSSTGDDWIQEYVDYRSSNPYNSYETYKIEVTQLYEQFGYGSLYHPLAIRNFANWAAQNWSDPQHCFIIGKAREYHDLRSPGNMNDALFETFFIPTMGKPGADNLLFSDNFNAKPVMSVGRLAAVSGDDIRIYFDKVKAFEMAVSNGDQSIASREWMKRVMHLGGGSNLTEQENIKGHLNGMETIIENAQFGAEVTSFYKTSTDPVETSQSAALKSLINDGIAVLTFFGHSSPNTFDFNFDTPTSYDNKDRYPLMFSFGCFSGQCHNSLAGIGEEFLLIEDKGAIAYFASTGYGFIGALDKFGDAYYQRLGNSMYGQSIGSIHQEVIEILFASNVVGDPELAQQSTLQGDPSLRLYPQEGPDYTFDGTTAKLNPPLINILLDSFDLQFEMRNLGYHIPDTNFVLEIVQELPSGDRVTLVDSLVAPPAFREAFSFRLPTLGEQSIGLNRFYLTLDRDNDIAEVPAFAESNNELVRSNGQLGLETYIVSNDVYPVWPPEFSIVSDPQPELSASSVDAFAETQTFVFQLDTTETFDSPIRTETKVLQPGGVIKWEPQTSWQNDRVYYWRISPDSLDESGYRWRESSFLYDGGGEDGWNQSHFYQFQKDTFSFLKLPEDTRKLAFIEDVIDIKIRNCIYAFPAAIPRYYIAGASPASYQGGVTNVVPEGVFIAVLDSITGEPIKNPGGLSWGEEYGPTNFKGFVFSTDDTDDRAEIINFLENGVSDNQFVIFFTVQQTIDNDYQPEEWGADTTSLSQSLYDALEGYGASQVRMLENLGSRPYALFFRKGDPSSVDETIGDLDQIFDQSSIVEGTWFEGEVFSVNIGPAVEWNDLQWGISDFEAGPDSMALNLYGIRPDGTDTLLVTDVPDFQYNLDFLDAAEYPQLKLGYFASDEVDRTPPHLKFWRVQFRGIPEAALHAAGTYNFHADSLQQGEPLSLDIAIENISHYDMDSVLVHFRITDQDNEELLISKRLKPLPQKDSLVASLRLDTRDMSGLYSLFIEANPLEDQPELTHSNNIGLLPFRVLKDEEEPLLDVTFDGARIMNGDIVSAEPEIVLSLRDENPFLELGDTSVMRMLLVYPDGSFQEINYNQPNIEFFGADVQNLDKENQARVLYRPRFEQDGMYTLYAEAGDVSGNQSGDLNYIAGQGATGYDYKISFQVINKTMISNVLNYPNPFSTQTYFVYTLTGSEPPPRFKIQIMTVSGRIVRELTQADLGMLKVGTHRTDVPWDGTDMFGDPLANGVYIYRVVAQKANGEAIEHYDTAADGFFQKGFGKMVIVR